MQVIVFRGTVLIDSRFNIVSNMTHPENWFIYANDSLLLGSKPPPHSDFFHHLILCSCMQIVVPMPQFHCFFFLCVALSYSLPHQLVSTIINPELLLGCLIS